MKKKELYEDMRKSMAALVQDLRGKPYAALVLLPKYADQERTIGRWSYKLATWRDELEDGQVQIMVQAYYHWFLGIGSMMADGFRKGRDETVTDVPQNVRYEFT